MIPLHAIDHLGSCTCSLGEKCKSAGKHPISSKWQNTPRLSAADVTETWKMHPYANVGVATGSPSGFFVLDVDPDNGGFDSMSTLVAQHGSMPATAVQQTGSGGWHYFFSMPDFDVRNKQASTRWLGGLTGIDVRGTGGQIVIAPSRSSKGPYHLNDRPIAPAPEWLLNELRPAVADLVPTVAPIAAPAVSMDTERRRLDAYVKSVIDREIARLHNCQAAGWAGEAWNATTHAVACNLVELANTPWTGITQDHVDILLLEHAPRDVDFGDVQINKCLWSARQSVKGNQRAMPAPRPQVDLFAGVPVVGTVQAAPGVAAFQGTRHSWDDMGNAHRIVEHLGSRVRWLAANQAWNVYDGKRWTSDGEGSVMALIQDLLENLVRMEGHLYSEDQPVDDAGVPDPKGKSELVQFKAWAAKQRMAARIDAAEKVARARPPLQACPVDFDADPMLLNCQNGVVDLRTGVLSAHDPSLLLSQITNVDFVPNTSAPRWEQFLARSMPDPHMRAYLQRAAGYSITGDISDQAMFIHQGKGANGKSQFLIAMQQVLGEYNQVVPRTTLLAKAADSIPTDIARMVGKRFLQSSETATGKRLDEETVKSLTGGESSVARHLYGREFEFFPTGKIHYATNHLPRLTDAESIWRRLHLFSWKVVIPDGDQVQNLGQLLAKDEGTGILSWLVAGCLSWQQVGLGRPDSSRADLLAYRTDQDELGEFFDDYLLPTAGGKVTIDAVYRAYVLWVSQSGLTKRSMSRQMLSMAMRERGYVPYRSTKERGFLDVTVTISAPATMLGLGF